MSEMQTAIFGGGCFWCLEAVFARVQGVSAAESGYMGGHVKNPAYREVCSGLTGHAEVVRVTFDPAAVSYKDLLDVFFAIHDPTTLNQQGNDFGTQYRSVIFYLSEEQRRRAEQAIADLDGAHKMPDPVVTAVEPASQFYVAEDYHQNYFANNPAQSYCQFVVAPKVRKLLKGFPEKVKA
ncbi:MAG: peptide-methionine (S)-S-oxide reductase MsrA [Acidobacteriia bacterium]|nr:peptide-methionine (S)-S-oxide reductase MsrA [Terriglobia bacterium]